ncbi:MAG: metal-transporting ATPase [Chlamydiae bacterium SM23_39]|nr:MAG: metal-transporting ATPase [Chlamydiae bacterium SM23_39]
MIKDISFINSEDVPKKEIDELFQELKSNKNGLSSSEAKNRLQQLGPNKIEEKKKSIFLTFLKYFWGPIPWMIEIAAILSIILHHWPDFFIILTLLLINGIVDFWEEFQAGNAIKALKQKLALKAIVKRDGKWIEIDSSQIVLGDIILIKLGNIIPADAKLIEGEYLTIDQSSLTGESLPVTKKIKDVVYSGSIAKQGEMLALVTSTGKNTFFGKTTKLVEKAQPKSHFQKAILQIGDYLIYISLTLAFLLITIQSIKGDPFLELTQFVLILIVASIPVAMPAVLSVTMALGALKLAKMKAVVTKLESIEEMAGIDILCCDKTGTLTQNKLILKDPIIFKDDKDKIILYGALASKIEGKDPIDLAVINGLKDKKELNKYTQIKFFPFDPINKKTEATIKDEKGNIFYVSKGAPQVILSLCNPDSNFENLVKKEINNLGKKGHRTLGVAYSIDGKKWNFQGLLPLSDPLREDSIPTIAKAKEHGIKIKMLTGDNIAIANEIASELKIGNNINILNKNNIEEKIEKSDGFAQIFPEHKYFIVKALQKLKHIVGMTGDGVNDAPALKQADVGIAVSNATDAARTASDLVLLAPGLSIIIKAIEEARMIFERMNSYAIYRITETVRIMFFIFFSILVFNFYPVTAIMIVLLALLNDIPIMTIVFDNALLSKTPVEWKMKRVISISTLLGITGLIATFLLLVIARDFLLLDIKSIQSLIFLKLSIAGHLSLFIARTKNTFFSKPHPSLILFSAILATQCLAALIVGFGIFVAPLEWKYIGFTWAYALIWFVITDRIKILFYKHLDFQSIHHTKFLKAIKKILFPSLGK